MAAALTDATTEVNGVKVAGADAARTWSKTVEAVQKQTNWQNKSITEIAGIKVADSGEGVITAAKANTSWTISYSEADGKTSIVEN